MRELRDEQPTVVAADGSLRSRAAERRGPGVEELLHGGEVVVPVGLVGGVQEMRQGDEHRRLVAGVEEGAASDGVAEVLLSGEVADAGEVVDVRERREASVGLALEGATALVDEGAPPAVRSRAAEGPGQAVDVLLAGASRQRWLEVHAARVGEVSGVVDERRRHAPTAVRELGHPRPDGRATELDVDLQLGDRLAQRRTRFGRDDAARARPRFGLPGVKGLDEAVQGIEGAGDAEEGLHADADLAVLGPAQRVAGDACSLGDLLGGQVLQLAPGGELSTDVLAGDCDGLQAGARSVEIGRGSEVFDSPNGSIPFSTHPSARGCASWPPAPAPPTSALWFLGRRNLHLVASRQSPPSIDAQAIAPDAPKRRRPSRSTWRAEQ